MSTMQERVLNILKEAGNEGVHSFQFYKNYMPTFSQRIGELIRQGYKITRVNRGKKGCYYIYQG